MEISLNGFENGIATFKHDGTVTPGSLVCFSDNLTVSKSGEGESFIGVAVTVRNGYAGVQLKGHTQVKLGDNSISPGWNYLASDGDDGIITGSDLPCLLVAAVDTENGYADIIF